MTRYIHPLAYAQSQDVGAGAHVWQFCVVFPKFKIGTNCNSHPWLLIDNDVVFGGNVTIKNGVRI